MQKIYIIFYLISLALLLFSDKLFEKRRAKRFIKVCLLIVTLFFVGKMTRMF